MRSPLNSDAKRLRTIIISFPLLVVTTAILYRRTVFGEEQRKIPRDSVDVQAGHEKIAKIGGVPWEKQDQHRD
ncbi:uncharacterized protein L203_105766 [Cryptococcus depauperatus CBS 7841]|uniref:Uncharacterized protein n=1 Tax=Cryptococcus depauperatus CBS 7841 TaxID=1295531 RepID=A0A1E3I9H2_9TREE|nr:hypothetical protein L203_04904 [Cryptococcus depauperatus CBS 7841]ODN89762.1 hypothetical protein L204_06029 [Cryptococcus depauperatus CBS 7855]